MSSRVIVFLASLSFVAAAVVASAESLDQTNAYLIKYVASSKVVFIRNGDEHTPAQAAEHMKAKYDHFKKDIKSPEDFIRLCASKSLLSGKPYLVRTPDGKQMKLEEWLTAALNEHRRSTP